jgi:hypothetical protein
VTDEPSLRVPLAVLGGVVAVLAALLGFVQQDASRHSDRAAAEGTRLAVAIFRDATTETSAFDMKSMLLRQQFQLQSTAAGTAPLATRGRPPVSRRWRPRTATRPGGSAGCGRR